MRRNRRFVKFGRAGAVMAFATVAAAIAGETPLPPVPYPTENAPSEDKRVLGKILFFEEQLSADNSVACATCHVMSRGGTDPRRRRNPGRNGTFGDDGDVFGSPGVAARAADGKVDTQSAFGLAPQVTSRTAPSPFASNYAKSILWDGRASDRFVDPVSNQVVVQQGGALESQALLPLVNAAEMGHIERSFPEILTKLAQVTPLALADRLPPDVAAALAGNPGYPELFRRAFGDTSIQTSRIAMALATYERTLLPDQTDFDRFVAGDTTALSEREQRGLKAFRDAGCVACHDGPLFTDNSMRATGVRPHREDAGRGEVSSAREDFGKFKVPSLRNVALKRSFFHDGKRTTLHEAVKFYSRLRGPAPGFVAQKSVVDPNVSEPTAGYGTGQNPEEVQFIDNQDPAMADIHLSTEQMADIETFLEGGLVDPRVQDETYPFDRPILASEHTDLSPTTVGDGRPGGNGVPEVIVTTPAFAGNGSFEVGVGSAPPGVDARLISWQDGVAPTTSDTIRLDASVAAGGTGTVRIPLTDVEAGSVLHFIWQVDDPNAPGGVSLSRTLDVPVFAPRTKALVSPTSAREPLDPAGVDDRDAYVALASFRFDRRGHRSDAAKDELSLFGRINPRGAGADLSQGRLTVSVGGEVQLRDAALDADGGLHGPTADASFDPVLGTVSVSLRGVTLGAAFDGVKSGASGRVDVPVVVTVKGLGLAEPSVTTEVPFSWRAKESGAVTGRFDFRRAGTERGTFQVTRVMTLPTTTGRVRVVASGVLGAPGREPFSAPDGLDLRVGASAAFSLDANQIVTSKKTGLMIASGLGAMRSLRIDTKRRVFALDVEVDDPALTAAPPGTVVPVAFRIDATPGVAGPAGAFETIAEVRIR